MRTRLAHDHSPINIQLLQPTLLVAHTVSLTLNVDGLTILVGKVVVVPALDMYVGTYRGAAVVDDAFHRMHQFCCTSAGVDAATSLQNEAGQYLGSWLQFASHHVSVQVLAMHL